jgi:hypothetical protein
VRCRVSFVLSMGDIRVCFCLRGAVGGGVCGCVRGEGVRSWGVVLAGMSG